MFIMNCDISSGLMTIHHSSSIWLPLKVVHDWIRINKPGCDRDFCLWCELQEITGVGVFWRRDLRQYSSIYAANSDFILQIKWRNSIIFEPRIRQLKTSPSCPDCQFANLNVAILSRLSIRQLLLLYCNTNSDYSFGHVFFLRGGNGSEGRQQ